MKPDSKIYVAGHRGLVGTALLRTLRDKGYTNVLTRTHAELDLWHEALGLVRAQQWDAAERLLRKLHESYPERKLYELYLERIDYYREEPPGEGWDGVTTFKTK